VTQPPDRRPLDLPALLRALERHRVQHVVIGGVAAQFWGSPHPTRALDLTPDPHPANLARLAGALTELGAREWVPGIGEPVQLPMDRRRLHPGRSLLTRTAHGELDVIHRPHGLEGGYAELAAGRRAVDAHGVRVQVAALSDLLQSAHAGKREKDRIVIGRLLALSGRLQDVPLAGPPERPYVPAPSVRRPEDALLAAGRLARLFDEVRPSLANTRRLLFRAVDSAMYGEPPEARGRIWQARRAVRETLEQLAELRADLRPELTQREMDEHPLRRGDDDVAAVLAHQAHDELTTAMELLNDPALEDPVRGFELLVEARLHAATADGQLDLLHLHLDRAARDWEREVTSRGE
jgi:hypothetical protein